MEQRNNQGSLYPSLAWTAGIFALTAFHHYYGSVVYGAPWRAHVVFIGGIALLLCVLLAGLYRYYQRKLLRYSYLILAVVLFGVLIGLFEGFYNHVIKNVLYFAGMDMHSWRLLFPAPTYEVPDNVLFESSGILQFPVGLAQLYSLYKVFRS